MPAALIGKVVLVRAGGQKGTPHGEGQQRGRSYQQGPFGRLQRQPAAGRSLQGVDSVHGG
jgi:hypothetical protein